MFKENDCFVILKLKISLTTFHTSETYPMSYVKTPINRMSPNRSLLPRRAC